MGKKPPRIAVGLFAGVLALLAVVGVDRLLGVLAPPTQIAPFLFPPRTHTVHETDEFRAEIRTNSLGFRDREVAPGPGEVTRVVAIGDSFTYGWGVDLEDTWVKQLERLAAERGRPIEMLNLGFPGANPAGYALIAEKTLAHLRPDLVVVAALQLDDLAATPLEQRSTPPQTTAQPRRREQASARRVVDRVLPNLARVLAGRVREKRPVREEQDESLERRLRAATPEQRSALERLDPEILHALHAGGLNPALVWLALDGPDYFLDGMDTSSESGRRRSGRVRLRAGDSDLPHRVRCGRLRWSRHSTANAEARG